MSTTHIDFTTQDIEKKLATIKDDNHVSLLSDGTLEGFSLKDGKLSVTIATTRDKAKILSKLCTRASQELQTLPGVERGDIILTAQRTKTQTPNQEPSSPRQIPPSLSKVKHIIAVASGKGGVGKSTSSVNIAAALTRLGLKVALLDADISGPSIHHMMGITSKPFVKDGKLLPIENWGIQTLSIGMLIPDREALIWRGPMVIQAVNQLLCDVAWGKIDVMIVDLPPGTGDIPLSLAQKTPLTGAVIVSTPQDIALIDARRSITMFQKLKTPILGVVENMSYFECPHCHEKTYLFARNGAHKEADARDVPFLGDVPLMPEIRTSADSGVPITLGSPASLAAKSWLHIGEKLKEQLTSS